VIATLTVEREAGPFGGVLVESPGDLSVGEGRQRLRMRFAPQTTLSAAAVGVGWEWLIAAMAWRKQGFFVGL
jgi:hypothetical protein